MGSGLSVTVTLCAYTVNSFHPQLTRRGVVECDMGLDDGISSDVVDITPDVMNCRLSPHSGYTAYPILSGLPVVRGEGKDVAIVGDGGCVR